MRLCGGRCGAHLIHFSDLDRRGKGNQGKASASISSVLRCSSNSSHRHTHSWSSTETSRIPSPSDNHVALGKIWCSTPAGGYSQSNHSQHIQHIQKTPSMISPLTYPPQKSQQHHSHPSPISHLCAFQFCDLFVELCKTHTCFLHLFRILATCLCKGFSAPWIQRLRLEGDPPACRFQSGIP